MRCMRFCPVLHVCGTRNSQKNCCSCTLIPNNKLTCPVVSSPAIPADRASGNVFHEHLRRQTTHLLDFHHPRATANSATAEKDRNGNEHCTSLGAEDSHDFGARSPTSQSCIFLLTCQHSVVYGATLSPVPESLTAVTSIMHRIAPVLKKPVYFFYDASCLLFTFVATRFPGLMNLFRCVCARTCSYTRVRFGALEAFVDSTDRVVNPLSFPPFISLQA